MPIVSIIIPIYNIESYLSECLDSILAQTIGDWETICVDDGSTDNSGTILDEYSVRDHRFCVIHKENAGVSMARNIALDKAQGEWITFVDGDDLLQKDALECLINAAQNSNTDVAIGGVLRFGRKINIYVGPETDGMYSPEELYIQYNSLCVWSWGKIYKRKLWDNIRFPKGIAYSEDRYILHRILFAYPKVMFVANTLYKYRQRSSSAYGSSWNPLRIQRRLALNEQIKFFEKNNYHRAKLFTAGLYLKWIGFDLRMLSKISEIGDINLSILEKEYKEMVFKYWDDFVDIKRKEKWNIFPSLGEMWINIKMTISKKDRLSLGERIIIFLKYDGFFSFLKRILNNRFIKYKVSK